MRQERSEAILSDVKGRDILSAGCLGHVLPTTEDERGHWLHTRLMRQFADAEIPGLDIDQANINCMRALGVNTELGDARHLSYHANFDAIILGEIIEHLENPGSCLEGCRRALKPGGRIIISTPNIFCAMQILMYLKNFAHAFNAEHVMWFCVQTRRTLVERCGLRIESFTFVDDLAPDTLRELPYHLFSNLWLEDHGFSRCAAGTPWWLFVLLRRNKSWQNPRFVALSCLQSQTSSFPLILLMPN